MMQYITPQFYVAIRQLAEKALAILEMEHENLAVHLRPRAVGYGRGSRTYGQVRVMGFAVQMSLDVFRLCLEVAAWRSGV